MKNIHPRSEKTAFQDRTTGKVFLIESTVATDRTIHIDGETFPLVVADITADSHPFWTGSKHTADTEGRVKAFERRYGKR